MSSEESRQPVAKVRTAVVAGCLLRQGEDYLLVQESKPSAYGLWNLPAGHVEPGEPIRETAAREVLEETGYEVMIGDRYVDYPATVSSPEIHIFLGTITGGELRAQPDEIQAVAWLGYEAIQTLYEQKLLRADWLWPTIRSTHHSI